MTFSYMSDEDQVQVANLIRGALERVAREQGAEFAEAAATRNVYGNVTYLREAVGDLAVIEMLGELREAVLHDALASARAP